MKYTLLRAVRHQDTSYRKGEEIELDDAIAASFAERKWIQIDNVVESKAQTNRKRRERNKAVKASEPTPESVEDQTDPPDQTDPSNATETVAQEPPKPARKRSAINADAV